MSLSVAVLDEIELATKISRSREDKKNIIEIVNEIVRIIHPHRSPDIQRQRQRQPD